MTLDQVEDALFDVRPDGVLAVWITARRLRSCIGWRLRDPAVRHRYPGRPGLVQRLARQVGHILDRHDDAQVQLLLTRRRDDGDGEGAAEEGSDFLRRPDSGRQPDPL